MKHLRTIRGRTWCPEPPKLYAQRIAQRRIGFYLLILALAVGSWAPAQADIFFRGISAETTLQAESASILGGASIYNDGAATGGQGVAYLDAVGNGFRFANAPEATSIRLRYASQNSGSISVKVNGSDAGNITFSGNGAWVGNYASVTYSVSVPAGATVDIVNNAGDAALNVDEVVFVGPDNTGGGTSTDVEAESGSLLGGASVYNDGAATGGQGVAYLDAIGNGFRLAGVPEASSIDLVYASQNSGTISILVNGSDAGDISFTGNGAWVGSYASVSYTVNIPSGATVDIVNQAGDVALNVDLVTFTGEAAAPTCSDGVQNGDETGVDCGGSCAPCSTCSDGVQNGDETGIDCGGSCGDCDPDPTCSDGIQNGDETGVDCGGSCTPCATCSDGIQNGDETGIDCGGSCGACATCDDGIQNGDETGVDCGGSCAACATCDDGIQNGDETGIDCGGSCGACATCDDGVQNGDETGVDCGGSCSACTTCSDNIQNGDETGVDCGGSCGACPTPPAQVEAESGTLLGAAQVYTDGAASGGQGVAYLDEAGNGFRLSGTPEAASITLHYASQNSGTISIVVNGNDAGNISYSGNGAWVGAYTDVTYDVAIPANSTVDIVNQAGDVAMNVDYVVFTGQAPDPTCTDGVQNGDETGVDCGGSCGTPCPNTDPVVRVSSASGQPILVGGSGSSSDGFTLYTWDNDNAQGYSGCEGGCASTWPPLLVNSAAEAIIPNLPAEFDGTFGIGGRCDGTLQLTYNGEPLYFYNGDAAEGQTNGDQPSGTWHMVIGTPGPTPTCTDGIMNGDETGVDCGGSCDACDPCNPDQGGGGGVTGDDFVMGLNSDGIAYHENVSHNPGFFVLSLDGAGGTVTQNAAKGNRYENDFSSIVQPGVTYTLEVRIQGDNYGTGQCIYSIQVQAGEGVSSTPCQTSGSGGGGDPTPSLPDPVLAVASHPSQGAYLAGSTGTDNPGFSLYTTTGTCTGGCLDTWPPLLVDDPELVNDPGGITNGIGTVYYGEVDCSPKYQATLDGQPLYFYANDNVAGDISGDNVGPWDLATVNRLPRDPDQDVMITGLKTPINGRSPAPFGWVHDVAGRNIQIRAGSLLQLQFSESTYVGGVGSVYTGPGNPDWTFVCSCNQKDFYEAPMVNTGQGVFETQVPGNCYDKYFYFFRYKKAGLPSGDPGTQMVYSGLFEYDERTPNDRIDPAQQPTITSYSANWMRFRHPRAHDGNTELIFNSQNNAGAVRALDRYNTTVTTGGSGTTINANLPNIIRIEALDNGLIFNANPAYVYNQNTCCGNNFDYGNVITYEITIGSGAQISSQIYNTFQHVVVGQGFNSSIGDPRLTLAGRAATTMEFSTSGSHVDLEQDAIFTQHLTTLTTTEDVDNFLEGHHLFHGLQNQFDVVQARPAFGDALIGDESCQNCHFRDGRDSKLTQTPNGPRVAPPVFGTGILQWIEGAEVGLTWDGSVATVDQQVRNALVNDHHVDPDQALTATELEQLTAYVKHLTVPNRNAAAYLDADVVDGHEAFLDAGCQNCHSETARTRSDAPAEFRDLVIRPYTDMKLWNVNGGDFRTPPLWGLGRNIDLLERNGKALLFMHNGSATTLDGAIQDHTGDAASSRSAYNGMSAERRANLIKFLETL